MGTKKELVLQYEDFDLNASKFFKNLRTESDFFDVTLGCSDSNGQLLQAHKVILASLSSVFKSMLKNSSGGSQVSNNHSLFLRGITYKDLSAILDFIYQGEVRIDETALNSFLSAADDLKIEGLSSKTFFGESLLVDQNTKDAGTLRVDFNNDVGFRTTLPSVLSKENVLFKNTTKIDIKKEVASIEEVSVKPPLNKAVSKYEVPPNTYADLEEGKEMKYLDIEEHHQLRKKKTNEINHILQKVADTFKSTKSNNDGDNNLTVEKNKKGGFNAVLDGNLYHINSRQSKTLIWQCIKRKVLDCKASMSTDIDMTKVKRSSPHNHEPIR